MHNVKLRSSQDASEVLPSSKPRQARNLLHQSNCKTIQDLSKEHPNHPPRSRSRSRPTSIDVSTRGHSISTEIFRPADCGVSGTPALASHHERRMREVARLDRSGSARRRRMPRVRRGARR